MKFLPLIFIAVAHAAPLSEEVVRNTAHEIDQILLVGQKNQKISPNPLIDDSTFLRRSYLNIIGRLPTVTEARTFLDSQEKEKRAHLIDQLVTSPGMKSKLFNFWADLLRLKTQQDHHGLGWHVWLREAVQENMPYDKMVHAMMSANKHVADNPAAGYYLRDRGMLLDNVSNTVQVFLGQQIGCAQCHDHPFDDTTQMEYYQLAAYLGGTEYRFQGGRDRIRELTGVEPRRIGMMKKGGDMMRQVMKKLTRKERRKMKAGMVKARDLSSVFRYHNRNAINDNQRKGLKLPEDYKYEDGKPGDVVKPATLFGKKFPNVVPDQRRKVFADWLASPENPYFTKVIANRLWDQAFGYGVVAAIDDWGNSPKPLYPELVTHLEKVMKTANYDVQQFLRILYHTQLFQREVAAEEPIMGSAFNFAGPLLRRMEAQEIRDSFLTLASGNIDDNTNTSFTKSWQEYTDSYRFLMQASNEELSEIDQLSDQAEKKRRAVQRQLSKLRTAFRKAREEGDLDKARELNKTMREQRKLVGKRGQIYGSELAKKARAAVMRRTPRKKANHPNLKLRSSELASPQRGGSLVAEFGGSDSETPSSAHTHATVPQTLRLLNGQETSLLTSRKNVFAQKLRQLDSPEERLDLLFLSLYSAYPTKVEKNAFLPEVKTPATAQSLARAILTSNRFLFVQ